VEKLIDFGFIALLTLTSAVAGLFGKASSVMNKISDDASKLHAVSQVPINIHPSFASLRPN